MLEEAVKRGQAATEYLIILAVVVIIALIVVGVLGGFQGITGGISRQQSETYWSSAEIGIMPNFLVNGTGAYLTLKNNRPFTVRINEVEVNDGSSSYNYTPTTRPAMSPGSTVNVDVPTTAVCGAGGQFSLMTTITYEEPTSGRTFTFTGQQPLVGECQ